jgi:queuine tRNA-ribosyltransferase
MTDCQCHACRHHTRAYIHHLLKSNELTADVLLYQHNQFQLMKVFENAQRAIAENDFVNWKNAIQKKMDQQSV